LTCQRQLRTLNLTYQLAFSQTSLGSCPVQFPLTTGPFLRHDV
jgi:hypothetical protein